MVASLRPAEGVGPDHLRRVAAALDKASNHPVSRAAAVDGVEVATGVSERPGLGVEGEVAGERAWLGKEQLLREAGIADIAQPDAQHQGPMVAVAQGANGNPASCHVGYRSCFYRAVDLPSGAIRYLEDGKTFDPEAVYGDAPNPTQL